MIPYPPTRLIDRSLLVGGCLWLLVSLVINRGLDSSDWTAPGDAASLMPAMRGLMQSIMIGLGLVWPAWRLSQRPRPLAGLQVVGDWIVLMLMVQVVVWLEHIQLHHLQTGLRSTASWSAAQTLLIDFTLVAWSLPVALCIWAGWDERQALGRTGAMLWCVALLTGGWIAAGLSGDARLAPWSPWYALWVLCDPDGAQRAGPSLWRLAVVAGLSVFAWIALLIRREPPRDGAGPL